MIDKTRFGEKHVCPKCKIKFYDMNRRPVICPNCGYNLDAPEENAIDEDIIEDDIPPIDTGEEDDIVTIEEVEETFGGDTIITTEIAEEDLDSDFDDT